MAGVSEPVLNGSFKSGPNITEIRSQILIYCQQRGIGKIANCLEVGSYDGMEEVVVDNALLGEIADPHKMQRDLYMELKKSAYAEHRTYIKSKEQLLGIIKSMTDSIF